jgi:hypothetical protein
MPGGIISVVIMSHNDQSGDDLARVGTDGGVFLGGRGVLGAMCKCCEGRIGNGKCGRSRSRAEYRPVLSIQRSTTWRLAAADIASASAGEYYRMYRIRPRETATLFNRKIAHVDTHLVDGQLSLLKPHGNGRILGSVNVRRDDDRLRSGGLEVRLMLALAFVPSASKLPSILLEDVSVVAI